MKNKLATAVLAAAVGSVTCAWLGARPAFAQDGASLPAPPLPPPAPLAPSPPAPPTATYAVVVPAAEVPSEPVNDHDRFVRRFGVTYFDITDLPIATPNTGGGLGSTTVSAPVIGARYWLTQRIGIDGGLGLGFSGGSDETVANGTDTKTAKVSSNGFAIHVGVPIVLAEARHFTFLAVPEATIGITRATYVPPGTDGGPNQALSGFLADVGARVGAEIHFGFIGVPQLALQATVGLSYRRSVYKESSSAGSSSDGTSTFGTQVNGDPWAIFKDGIAATYYF